MAHVQIKQESARGPLRVIVDGVDLTGHVYDEGFGLVQVGEGPLAEWGVQMVLAADDLDIDLPEAVVQVTERSDFAQEIACMRKRPPRLVAALGALDRQRRRLEAAIEKGARE